MARDQVKKIQKRWGIQPPSKRSPDSVRRWLRSTGFISAALGVGGLMQLLFWPSVCLIYLALVVLAWDLYYEPINRYVKMVFGGVMLFVLVGFSLQVVLRKAPVSADFQIVEKDVKFVLRNDSTEDAYKNLDLIIWPDADRGAVMALWVKQTGGYPINIFNTTPDHIGDPGGPRPNCPPFAGTLYVNKDHTYSVFPNTIRIHADVLPRGAYVEVTAALIRGYPLTKDQDLLAQEQFTNVSRILVDGSVDGPFRNFHIHTHGYERGREH